MRTKIVLSLATILMLVIGVAAIASNMGFKIDIQLTASQTKFVSLPYNNSYTDAASLYDDIVAAGGTNVVLYYYNGVQFQRYAGGGRGDIDFAITPGISYEVSSASSINWVVVGSHDPNLAIAFSASQAKFVSVPYHTLDASASALYSELETAGATNLVLYKFNGTTFDRYAGGGRGDVDFAVTAGDGVEVISATAFSWTPAHY